MIAVAAPQRDYLSYSAVRTFQGCPAIRRASSTRAR